MAYKCNICGCDMERRFLPMKQWDVQGPLCGRCYSEKIGQFYPGEHVRMGD